MILNAKETLRMEAHHQSNGGGEERTRDLGGYWIPLRVTIRLAQTRYFYAQTII